MTTVIVNEEESLISIDFSHEDRLLVEQAAADLGYDLDNYIRSVLYSALEPKLREDRFQYYLRTGKSDTSPALAAVLKQLSAYPVTVKTYLNF